MNQLRRVTWSKACTIVPTYECFNRCSYCNFRRDYPSGWISLSETERVSRKHRDAGAIEALIMSGEVHPSSSRRVKWLGHIAEVCKVALHNGLLPHINVGPLTTDELEVLSQVSVSMGLMLEQASPKLVKTVHRRAPSKSPSIRLQHLRAAGRLKIPFTTGILLGIGEDEQDREESLRCIADVQQEFGNIQECIIQPFCPGERGYVAGYSSTPFNIDELPSVVATARAILPREIALQVPPNLVFAGKEPRDGFALLLRCIEAGATDLGGISPIDEVNPSYSFPNMSWLEDELLARGYQLLPRLPVYERFIPWLKRDKKREYMFEVIASHMQELREKPFTKRVSGIP
ncbi:hypothetical protein CCYA_CCYA01G0290 [Cyanidiococcus yangmingshanensis]|nr:hypothetical protein CCYA_CCYA01G0290 [Cyanidiococcus yangmingshanensis]